jgi:hypothetical protein
MLTDRPPLGLRILLDDTFLFHESEQRPRDMPFMLDVPRVDTKGSADVCVSQSVGGPFFRSM